MADIAMLVAEEYERRVKKSRKIGANGEEIDLFSSVSVLAQKLDWIGSFSSSWIKLKFGNWVVEPKTQIGVAAINGFFSA